jgi:hypothetical protein
VNGTDAETAAIDGVLQIKAIDKSEADMYDSFRFSRGMIQGLAGYNAKLTKPIPNDVWGDPVISIGKEAFKNAFKNERVLSLTIPGSVASIGYGAFSELRTLSKITIGANVYLEKHTRNETRCCSQNGGSYQVAIDESALRKDFIDFYNENGKKAGIYNYISYGLGNQIWVYGESQEEIESTKEELKRTEWAMGLIILFGGGISLNMNEIDPNYFKSLGYHWNPISIEFYKRNIKFFRFGFNLDLGSIDIDEDMVRKMNPNISSIVTNFNCKINAFARLYPADFLFLSGGIGLGRYSITVKEPKSGSSSENPDMKKVNLVGISTPIFPVGGGIFLRPFPNKDTGGIVIESLYNIVPFKGRTAAYISINAGIKFTLE